MKRWQIDGALFGIVLVWGSTFFIVRGAVQTWEPFYFLALRFGFGALVLLPLALPNMRHWTRLDLKAGVLLSLPLFVGFATQTYGLKMIPAARGGFITGLNVVFVPLLGALLFRERVRLQVWLGVLLAVAGMWVLSQDGADGGSLLGDGLVLICAVTFAIHILMTGYVGRGRNALALNVIQIAMTGFLSLLGGLVVAPFPTSISGGILVSGAYLGVICTAIVLIVQTVVQRYASPTHTALVFVLEPVFAAIFAAMFANEPLTIPVVIGGSLMLAGIVLAEIPLFKPKDAPQLSLQKPDEGA